MLRRTKTRLPLNAAGIIALTERNLGMQQRMLQCECDNSRPGGNKLRERWALGPV
jgi:hypothetical protein